MVIPVTWGKKASVNAHVYLEATAQSPPHVAESLGARETLSSDESSENWQQSLMPPLKEKQEVSCYTAWPKAHMYWPADHFARCSAQAAGQRGSLRNEGVGGQGELG